MLHLHRLAKMSSARGVRIWSAGTTSGTSNPWFLTRTSRTIFATSRRSSVNRHQESQQKLGETETPHVESLPEGSRSPSIYAIILALGVGLTTYGVYHVFESMTMWPEAIRGDLREGIKYRNQGEFLLSIPHLRQAWEKSKSLPLALFKPDSLLKTSGIAIVLAGVLEDGGKKEEAYKVYEEAFWQLQSAYVELPPDAPHPEPGTEALKPLTGPERMRAAAIAYKLGCMAPELGKPDKEEEKWLNWAVNATLMAMMEAPADSETEKQLPSATTDGERNKPEKIMAQDLRLPAWSKMHNLAAPFEALGTFYSKYGNRTYALPLYLQAVSILIPPPPMITSAEDRCRGAGLMGRISETILRSHLSDGPTGTIAQATSWAQKGLDIVIATRESHPNVKYDGCELAYIALLLNVALMRRLSGDEAKARELYITALKQSKVLGHESVTRFVQEALQDSKLHNKSEDKTV